MELSDEFEAVKRELEAVKKEFNDYKILTQCKTLPEAESYKYMVRFVKEDLEKTQYVNDALLNFIAINGLGAKYYEQFIEQDYPYDMLDFETKNEAAYSEFEKGGFLAKVRYQISKTETQN